VLNGNRVLKQYRLQGHPEWLPAVERLPALLGEQTHQAVANVVVHAQHIGPGVVHMVVGMPPEVGWAGDIPFVAAPGKFRVVHPVVLTMNDVMPQLHVLEDLAQAQ
jgi:hypothetical protein